MGATLGKRTQCNIEEKISRIHYKTKRDKTPQKIYIYIKNILQYKYVEELRALKDGI